VLSKVMANSKKQ